MWTHLHNACIVNEVMLPAAHETLGILLKSLSLHWFLLHLHILSSRWQARNDFNKKKTAI